MKREWGDWVGPRYISSLLCKCMLNRIIDICRRISYFVGLIILLTRYMNRYMNARKLVPLTPKHIEEGTKWPPFSRRHFRMRSREWRYMNFDFDSTEVCSQGSNKRYACIGVYVLPPLRRQAIFWANDGRVGWRIYELKVVVSWSRGWTQVLYC